MEAGPAEPRERLYARPGPRPGWALVVYSDGSVEEIPLR